MSGFERGRRLGLDVGTARIGVASCDPDGILATPVETIAVRGGSPGWKAEIRRVAELAEEYDAREVVVGLPKSLRGRDTQSTQFAREFAQRLAEESPDLPVHLADERLTTVSASAAMRGAGRSAKKQKSVIDQAAAVLILQNWLDTRRLAGGDT